MSFEGLEPCPSGHKAEFSLVPDAIRCSEKSCAWHMVRVPISDWNTRATPPGTEMAPEGMVDDLINVWAAFLTGGGTREQVHEVIKRFTATGRTQKEPPNAKG